MKRFGIIQVKQPFILWMFQVIRWKCNWKYDFPFSSLQQVSAYIFVFDICHLFSNIFVEQKMEQIFVRIGCFLQKKTPDLAPEHGAWWLQEDEFPRISPQAVPAPNRQDPWDWQWLVDFYGKCTWTFKGCQLNPKGWRIDTL